MNSIAQLEQTLESIRDDGLYKEEQPHLERALDAFVKVGRKHGALGAG